MHTTMNTLKSILGIGMMFGLSANAVLAAGKYPVTAQVGENIAYKTSYEVPVKSPELIPFAHLEMAASIKKLANGQVEFCYHLPWEIVSKNNKVPRIVFTTTKQIEANTYEVEGEHSFGTCTFGDKKSSCHLFYNDLNLDENATKAELATKFTGEELEKRSMVAEIFVRDPEGVLLFEIP